MPPATAHASQALLSQNRRQGWLSPPPGGNVVRQSQEPFRLSLPTTARASRRTLLPRLVALPAALGIAALAAPGASDAKKKRRKRKRKRRGRSNGGGGDNGDNNGGGGTTGGGGYSPDAEERACLTLINTHRRATNRPALSLNDQLGVAAERHSQDQANRDRGGHTGSDGSNAGQRITRAGYDWRAWGENVFWSKPDGSAQAAFTWWKNSPGHNANMLSRNFSEIGIGRVRSNSGWWYWTTTFGRR
jgi:uncharacterized protein YkwD